jgi:FAD/FMN-containing dehydrogenase
VLRCVGVMQPRAWARERGIAFAASDELPSGDFRTDPRVDFGRLARRCPGFVLSPRSIDEVATCFGFLAAERLPYKLRGAAHSASGEVLIEGGAVVDLSGLAGIVADDPDGETITALGGTSWLALWEHLTRTGRRPLVLTDNPRTTLAGTLAVGGVGDASHRHGPQVAGVRRLVLVTPDGARRTASPGDPYFDHALCGHGQLGAIAEVTLATCRLPTTITGRVLRWGALEAFLSDAVEIASRGLYSYVRGRLVWNEGMTRVWAIAAHGSPEPEPELAPDRLLEASEIGSVDVLVHARVDPVARWAPFNPCVEVVLPYPAGLAALRSLDDVIGRGPLARYLPRGSSIAIVRGTRGLPLSPFSADPCIVLAIRPEPPTQAEAHACEPELRALAERALDVGGRLYLASFALAGDALATQLGGAVATLAALKAAVDPDALCCRGSLHGWDPGAI